MFGVKKIAQKKNQEKPKKDFLRKQACRRSLNLKDVRDTEFPNLSNSNNNQLQIVNTPENGSVCDSGDSITCYRGLKAFVYRTLQKVRVRADKTIDSPQITILNANVEVKVVEVFKGKKGKIVEPVEGWVSLRKKGKKCLEQIFTGTPSVCLRNIPKDKIRIEKDLQSLLIKNKIKFSKIVWRRISGSQQLKNHAFIEFDDHQCAERLMKKAKQFFEGKHSMKVNWSKRYAQEVDV